MLELYRHNNYYKTSGILKQVEPLNLQFGGFMNHPEYTQVHFLPSVAWNYYDKAMFGMLFYDAPLPPDKLDYYLAPMISTGSGNFAGTGTINFNFYTNSFFKTIDLNLSGKQYSISDVYPGQFQQLKAEAVLGLSGKNRYIDPKTTLHFSFINATAIEDVEDRILNNTNNPFSKNNYYTLTFEHNQFNRTINPYKFSANLKRSDNFTKAWVEGQYKYSYYRNEGLTLRVFGGTFLETVDNLPWNYAFHLSGENGFQDYSYERTFLGRFEPPQIENAIRILTQQFYPTDGAFILYSNLGITKDWMASFNVKTSLPLIKEIPIHAYANFGIFGNTYETQVDVKNNSWAIESGFKLSFLNLIDIYFPVAASANLEKANRSITEGYGEQIRFHIRFNLLKPSSVIESLSF